MRKEAAVGQWQQPCVPRAVARELLARVPVIRAQCGTAATQPSAAWLLAWASWPLSPSHRSPMFSLLSCVPQIQRPSA